MNQWPPPELPELSGTGSRVRLILTSKRPWLCYIWHRWKLVWSTRKTHYEECTGCGSRRAWQELGGHQPIDMNWILAAGEENANT